MTCIVGIEHADGVTIGGDAAASSGGIIVRRDDAKVFSVGPYLFGFTTSFRMGQLLQYSLKPPVPSVKKLDRHMRTKFVDSVRQCLKDGGYATIESGVETGGTFLVGVLGKLFMVDADYQVGHQLNGYDAVGSGEYVALGSLHTTAHTNIDPVKRVTLALEAAAEHTTTVAGPFTIETMY